MPLLLNFSDPWRSYLTSLQEISMDYSTSMHIQGKVRPGLTNLTGKDMMTLLDSVFYLQSERKIGQSCQLPSSCPTHEKVWHQNKRGWKNKVSYDILYCWRVNSRLLLSDLLFFSSNPSGEGQKAQALHPTRIQVRRNCIVTAPEKRKGS